jgi:hypothetical protein
VDRRLKEGFQYDEFSALVATYAGSGILSTPTGSFNCRFRADQECSGKLQVVFDQILPTDFAFHLIPLIERPRRVSFRGTTDDDVTVVLSCDDSGRPLSLDTNGYASIYFRPKKLTAYSSTFSATPPQFLLTNFAFSPFTHLGEPPRQPESHVLSLNVAERSHAIDIQPLSDYVRRIVRLWQTRDILPTAQLVIKSAADATAPSSFELVTNICKLLSVVAGTVVQWLAVEGFDQEKRRGYRLHVARLTKPYCSLPLVPIAEFGYQTNSNILQSFLQGGLEQMHQLEPTTINGLIAAFLDARLEHDYIEARGIKTAVVLEILKGLFNKELSETEWDVLLPKPLRKRISTVVRAALEENDIQPEAVEIAQEALAQLSRPTFRRVVLFMLRKLALPEDDTAINAAVWSRNSLVHTGRFLSTNNPQKATSLNIADAAQEFFLLLSFVDRLLLRLLGHSGLYIDYSRSTRWQLSPVIADLPVRAG